MSPFPPDSSSLTAFLASPIPIKCILPTPRHPCRLHTRRLHTRRLQSPLPPHRSTPRFCMVTAQPSPATKSTGVDPPLYDVIVIGAGPAGLALTAALASRSLHVFCADPTLHARWPNNYGTWLDDLVPLALQDCVSHVWSRTAAHVSPDGRKSSLPRPYARVDRDKLKARFLHRIRQSENVTLACASVQCLDIEHPALNYVTLDRPAEGGADTIAARLVVDATGHSLKFINVHEGDTPGFQAAYGIECIVSDRSYPYHPQEMLLMDFRDDHMRTPEEKRISNKQPTFLYVMPMDEGKGRHVFFEETSLVASPAMDFQHLKQRLYKRLGYYGIEVEKVHEEEFCLIPMGGEMPDLQQRVVAFGGAAALVHPATGYMIARALKLANEAAAIIARELERGGDADETSSRIWHHIWNEGRRRQRDFFAFGGQYLQHIDLDTTREFFSAFFRLPTQQWADFLSFRLIKPLDRLLFGLGVFKRTTNRVRATLVLDAVRKGQLRLLMSVLPLYKVDGEQ